MNTGFDRCTVDGYNTCNGNCELSACGTELNYYESNPCSTAARTARNIKYPNCSCAREDGYLDGICHSGSPCNTDQCHVIADPNFCDAVTLGSTLWPYHCIHILPGVVFSGNLFGSTGDDCVIVEDASITGLFSLGSGNDGKKILLMKMIYIPK